jgi:DHA1 family tetracycline resistance protein-like MFS transporter
MAFGLGFILGPALGGALSQISLAAPAYAAGTLSLLSALAGFVVLRESLPPERRTSGTFRWQEINPLWWQSLPSSAAPSRRSSWPWSF